MLILVLKMMILPNKFLHSEHYIITKFCQEADKVKVIKVWPLKKLPQAVCCSMEEPKITDFNPKMHVYDQKLPNRLLWFGHSFMKSTLSDSLQNFVIIKCSVWKYLLCKIIILRTKINKIYLMQEIETKNINYSENCF